MQKVDIFGLNPGKRAAFRTGDMGDEFRGRRTPRRQHFFGDATGHRQLHWTIPSHGLETVAVARGCPDESGGPHTAEPSAKQEDDVC